MKSRKALTPSNADRVVLPGVGAFRDCMLGYFDWEKKDYTLRAVNARSGALRYEDAASGLVWLVIVGKAMLLDTKHGKQLANDCKV